MLKVATIIMLMIVLGNCSSWDAYIDSIIANSGGNCDKAAIIGKDGSIWTSSSHANHLKVTASEAASIATGINPEDELTQFRRDGITIDGVKYQFLRKDDNAFHGKKLGVGSITMHVTNIAIVIGHTPEGKQGFKGETDKGVGHVADYLMLYNF